MKNTPAPGSARAIALVPRYLLLAREGQQVFQSEKVGTVPNPWLVIFAMGKADLEAPPGHSCAPRETG